MQSFVQIFAVLVAIGTSAMAAGLADLATVAERTSHRASSHDPTGGNEDTLVSFVPGETRRSSTPTAPAGSPTSGSPPPGSPTTRPSSATWSSACTGRTRRCRRSRCRWAISSASATAGPTSSPPPPISVGDNPKALNCYWPMPFHKHARIELVNNGQRASAASTSTSTTNSAPSRRTRASSTPNSAGTRTCERRHTRATRPARTTTSSSRPRAAGQYVGCALFVDAQPGGWWGEGDDMIFIDTPKSPSIIGTGSEDYFCNAWGFQKAFSYPYYGCPLLEQLPDGSSLTSSTAGTSPTPFASTTHIRVTIEHLFNPKVVNDYSSVAYWYQTEPVKQRPPLPPADKNQPRSHAVPTTQPVTTIEMSATELEPAIRAGGAKVRCVTANLWAGYESGGYLEIQLPQDPMEVSIPVPADGRYRLRVKPVNSLIEGQIRLSLKGGKTVTFAKRDGHERTIPLVDLGEAQSSNGSLILILGGNRVIGLDQLKIERTDNKPPAAPAQPTPAKAQSNPADA